MMFFFLVVIFMVAIFCIQILDFLLKRPVGCLSCLRRWGLSVQRPLQLRWFTTALNATFRQLADGGGRLLDIWFCTGALCSLLLLLPALGVLFYSLSHQMAATRRADATTPADWVLEPVIPGVNRPVSDIPLYIVVIAISSIVHEFGHAIAAIREGVSVHGCGLLMFVCVPAAYVDVSYERLASLPTAARLRVLCAGVWHNVVLAVCALIFTLGTGVLLAPLYSSLNQGVLLYHMSSDVAGVSGFETGDLLTAVDDCPVTDTRSWTSCLTQTMVREPISFCVSQDYISEHDETVTQSWSADGVLQCCSEQNARSHVCFESAGETAGARPESCLPARGVLQGGWTRCDGPVRCHDGRQCVRPVLANGTRLLSVRRQSNRPAATDAVLYLGSPAALHAALSVSEWRPRGPLPLRAAALPSALQSAAVALASVSAGLALLNLLPAYGLDGQWIWCAVLEWVATSRYRPRQLQALSDVVCTLGTVLLVACVLLTLANVLHVW